MNLKANNEVNNEVKNEINNEANNEANNETNSGTLCRPTEKYFAILTYGCQMNENDSEKFAGQLSSLGYKPAEKLEKADLILLNTCCVRESAEKKIWGKIGELKKLKTGNPSLILGIAGCMAQKDRDKLLKKFTHLDFVIGTHNIHQLSQVVAQVARERKSVCRIFEDAPAGGADLAAPGLGERRGRVSAWVPITYGCDNFCSYCIVPYVRGREKSRPLPDILSEIRSLGANGYKEITLLGQNVNSYGKDSRGAVDFADLLAAADKVETIERIRFMTSHPRDMTGKIIGVAAASQNGTGKICQHFHLPVQSGSDPILKAMNRGYTTEYYQELAASVRRQIPGLSLTTDIIVGFPGETEELFQETLDFVAKIRFDAAYTFLYSKRSGTPAADFAGQVPPDVKKSRLNRLAALQNAISLEINQKLVNTCQEVLIEGPSKNDPAKYTGRTRTNKIVVWDKTGREEPGRLADIRITGARTWTLTGRI